MTLMANSRSTPFLKVIVCFRAGPCCSSANNALNSSRQRPTQKGSDSVKATLREAALARAMALRMAALAPGVSQR